MYCHKALAKRSQQANATYRNIVGRNMLLAFGCHVAMCCDMLGVVRSNLTIFNMFSATHVQCNTVAKLKEIFPDS